MSETREETPQPETAPPSGEHAAEQERTSAPEDETETAPTGPREGASDEAPSPPGADRGSGATARAPRPVFRFTRVSLLVILTVVVCISPAAAAMPWFALLYLVPLGLVYWIVRMRTVAGPAGLSARSLFRTDVLDWTDVRALRLDERRWVRAITHSEREIPLPAVRVRDVPRLAAASGGRLRDPLAATGDDEGSARE